jgi:hypothetical protein
MSVSSNNAGSLSLSNSISNAEENGRIGDNILLRCPLEGLSEIFFTKKNVRRHTNKSVVIHVKF